MTARRPFGMLADKAVLSPLWQGRLIFQGPMVGKLPEIGASLILHPALVSEPEIVAQLSGTAHFQRKDDRDVMGVVVDGLSGPPELYQGAIISSERGHYRRHMIVLRAARPSLSAAARFDFPKETIYGLIRLQGVLLTAWLVDEPAANNLTSLLRIMTAEGTIIDAQTFCQPALMPMHKRPARPFPMWGQIEKIGAPAHG